VYFPKSCPSPTRHFLNALDMSLPLALTRHLSQNLTTGAD
jgi:hypothetical protein